ncbi:hypothetical protein JXA48_01615 [Candidatus Woesearchaeota archaeon]|nr:hypothetical protein [Candidatus Woesearchaeota archaeon]
MKLIHNITITVLVKPDENSKLTGETILEFLPEDLDAEKIRIEETLLKAEYGDDITKFTVKLEKERHTKIVINKIKELLEKEQIKRLRDEENRIDEQGMFYLRLDRQKLEKEGKAELTDKGYCFHFKIMLACFPKNREKAIEVAKDIWTT